MAGDGIGAAHRPPAAMGAQRFAWRPMAALVLLALAIRSPTYGALDIRLDEIFYALVGDRMWQGALPYVDIWDRKPIGLFLIFAATRLLGGDGFVQYQLVASLAAGGTAAIICAMARPHAGTFGGLLAGLCYIFWLGMFAGLGGQAPVFYNLLMASAAWAALGANREAECGRIARRALWAMLACGLAIQVKYTVLPEAIFFGCWFLWRLRAGGLPTGRIATVAAGMIAIALAPTLLATAFYAAIGQFQAFYFANFQSVFLRGDLGPTFARKMGLFFLFVPWPLTLVMPFAFARLLQSAERRDAAFLALWLLSALAGFGMVGNFFDHYFLPVLVPAFVIAAAMLRSRLTGAVIAAGLILWSVKITGYPATDIYGGKSDAVRRLTAASRPYLKDRCLFLYDGPSSLYATTNACIPTRFAFADHLANAAERPAIGVDTAREMRRILDSRPGVIVTADRADVPITNGATFGLLERALNADYACIARAWSYNRFYYAFALKREIAPGTPVLRCPRNYPDRA